MTNDKAQISNIDIRDAFFDELYVIAKNDRDVVFLTADMGAHSLNRFKKDLKKQYINVGVAEQNMVSVAAGLALGGKKVFIYTIIPFVTLRCYEQIQIDICSMNLPVAIIGAGPGFCYESDGPTHHGTKDISCMRALPKMTILNPSDSTMAKTCARAAYKSSRPIYIRIDKGRLPLIYDKKESFKAGIARIKKGKDLTIISTGTMVHKALEIEKLLSSHSISATILDLYRIKPLNVELLLSLLDKSRRIVTMEENSITGGIGSAVAEVLHDNKIKDILLKRIGILDEHCFECGSRESLHALYNLDTKGIKTSILDWMGTS